MPFCWGSLLFRHLTLAKEARDRFSQMMRRAGHFPNSKGVGRAGMEAIKPKWQRFMLDEILRKYPVVEVARFAE